MLVRYKHSEHFSISVLCFDEFNLEASRKDIIIFDIRLINDAFLDVIYGAFEQPMCDFGLNWQTYLKIGVVEIVR